MLRASFNERTTENEAVSSGVLTRLWSLALLLRCADERQFVAQPWRLCLKLVKDGFENGIITLSAVDEVSSCCDRRSPACQNISTGLECQTRISRSDGNIPCMKGWMKDVPSSVFTTKCDKTGNHAPVRKTPRQRCKRRK